MEHIKESLRTRSLPWKGVVYIAVALLILGWLLNTPPGLLGKADAIGYAVCHRIDIRSLHLGDRQMPLCVRCSGMYLGAMLGLGFQAWISPRRSGTPPVSILVMLGIFIAAFVIDGLNSFFNLIPFVPTLYEPQHWLRMLTGSGMGLVIAIALYPAFNQTVWKQPDERPAITNLISMAGLVLLTLSIDGLVLTENPLILYPLALISAGGVIVILTLVYGMLCLILFKRENCFSSLQQMLFLIIAGLGIAFAQIIVLDIIRYMITGTWDGFYLG